jgi:hypothetical protein
MTAKEEKERRRKIQQDLKNQQKADFESSLPMNKALFQELFDYLDEQLGEHRCDDTLKLTEQFLTERNVENAVKVIFWLEVNHGYCDCEVLNIEDAFN